MKNISRKFEIAKELEQIRNESGGSIKAEAIVEKAKNPESAMHTWFTWDDSEAARQHRLWQARQLIKVHVEIIQQAPNKPIRTYVSLESDRYNNKGGGYRKIDDVLTDIELREQLLEQATKEFERWKEKYQHLQELAGVFEAMEEFKQRKFSNLVDNAVINEQPMQINP